MNKIGYFISICIIFLSSINIVKLSGAGEKSNDPIITSLRQLLQNEILEYKKDQKHISLQPQNYLVRRCFDFVACEFHAPMVEFQNVVFQDGSVLLTRSETGLSIRMPAEELNAIHGSKPNHLPACLAQIGANNYDFIAGPRIGETNDKKCVWKKESAFFHFPWEFFNGFHSLNDNVLALLSNVYLQSLLMPELIETPKHIYMFKAMVQAKPTTMYQLITKLFTTSHAKEVMTKGPHCVQHGTWGTPFKVFYKDSLQMLRLKMYQFFKLAISNSFGPSKFPFQLYQAPTNYNNGSHAVNVPVKNQKPVVSPEKKKKAKVIIITRKGSSPANLPQRKLADETEKRLLKQFQQSKDVREALICCDFSVVRTIDQLLEIFWDVDICIGIHGAGLANCLFGRKGMVMVEFATHHNYGFDPFMKIAHMALGHYIFYDVRNAKKYTGGDGPGASLPDSVVNDVVALSLGIFQYSQEYALPLLEKKLANYDHHPNQTSIYRQFHQKHDHGFSSYQSITTKNPPSKYSEYTKQIHETIYSAEIIINVGKQELFVHSKYSADYQFLLDNYLTSLPGMTKKSPSDHVLYKNIEVQKNAVARDGNLINFHVQKKRPKHQFMAIDGITPHSLPEDHREFMIFLNPYLFQDMTDNILGPPLKYNYLHCSQQPYFKFRMLTMPFREHRGDCDKHIIQKKRTGQSDHFLLGQFVKD